MNVRFSAMAFVIGVRLVLLAAALSLLVPVWWLKRILPGRRPPPAWLVLIVSKLGTFKRMLIPRWLSLPSIRPRLRKHCPEWVERHSSGAIMLKTTVGMERADRLVDRIPTHVIDRWRRYGAVVFAGFVVVWGAVLLAGFAWAIWTAGVAVIGIADWASTADWVALFNQPRQPPSTPEFSLEAVVTASVALATVAAYLAAVFALSIPLWWAVMLPFMPGLMLHELGHYAALRKAGASVDSYGLLLFGPYLGGAFVQPGDDSALLDHETTIGVWVGGVSNTIIYGAVLLAAGLLLGGDPVRVGEMVAVGEWDYLFRNPMAAGLTLLGLFELGNGFINAMPLGPVDGGGFIRAIEQEWWGFDKAIRGVKI